MVHLWSSREMSATLSFSWRRERQSQPRLIERRTVKSARSRLVTSRKEIILEVCHILSSLNDSADIHLSELSLLRAAPRAATVSAIHRNDPSQPKLKVCALNEAAFTRLLGPLREIMERKAGESY